MITRGFFRRLIPNKYLRRLVYLIVGLLFYCLVAIPSTLSIISDGILDYSQLTPSQSSSNQYYIKLYLNTQEQDLSKKFIKYYIDFEPSQLASQGLPIWDRNITFGYSPIKHSVKEGDLIEPIEFQINIVGGNIKNYPFDVYFARLGFIAINNSTGESIPLEIITFTNTVSTQNSFAKESAIDSKGHNYIFFNIKIYRNAIVIFGCVVVCIVIWVFTILMMILAYDGLVHRREYPYPIMGLGISILFALPAVRKTLPGIPEYGSAVDYLCFFWADILISISSCLIIGCFTLRWKPEI
jgi:hypothetical protein